MSEFLGTARIERVVTTGSYLSGSTSLPLENNVWLLGNEDEVFIIDAAHDAGPILDAVAGRRVSAIIATHGHWDHVNAVTDLRRATGAPILLNPADRFLWDDTVTHPWDEDLTDGQIFEVAGLEAEVRFTPGHTPGSISLYVDKLGVVFTGDTLFEGGPGATRWDYSSFPTIIDSITNSLLSLPHDTKVLTGHGPSTTIKAEAPHLDEWIRRGY